MPTACELDEIRLAWKALTSTEDLIGWRTILVAPALSLPVRAARRFPGGKPSILVGANHASIPSQQHLPNARGFRVEPAEIAIESESHAWLAITLLEEQDQALFEMMILDLLEVLNQSKCEIGNGNTATILLLKRIRAWQEFMDRSRLSFLTEAEEIGLNGELYFLKDTLEQGVDANIAVNSWKGPFGGNQDFQIGLGAIEVKSTIAKNEFPAKIGNLDQLDSSLVSPLYLAAFRFDLDPNGISLSDLVNEILDILSDTPTTQSQFRLGLLRAGYTEIKHPNVYRKFKLAQKRIFQVAGNFPRLTHYTVPKEVVHASYTIDIDRIEGLDIIDHKILLIRMGAIDGTA